MQLSELLVDTKSAWVDYPGFDGFSIEVVNLAKPELMSLRKRCIKTTFDRKTHRSIEELDEEKWLKEFTKATIKDWKGLKLKYLEDFIIVDLQSVNPEDCLPYSREDAYTLAKLSNTFENWISEVVFDLDNFRTVREGEAVETSGNLEQ